MFPEIKNIALATEAIDSAEGGVSFETAEQPWIACEIHDGFVQEAMAAKMLLETALQTGEWPASENLRHVQRAADLLEKAIFEARRLIGGTRLKVLDELGMVRAIEEMIDELPADAPTIRFLPEVASEPWDHATEVAVYRIVQQAIHNIRRHSGAKEAEIRLSRKDEYLHLQIEDRGVGFDPAQVHEDRFGLHGIKQRARLLGGWATIESTPGQGTRISVGLPVAKTLEQ